MTPERRDEMFAVSGSKLLPQLHVNGKARAAAAAAALLLPTLRRRDVT